MKLHKEYDICVIGGGVNGAGIARDAAGCGLSVLLLEARDLGGATSSASTKLIHGGLRYLEYFEFGLVRESLQEREALLNMAPHIIWPMNFVLPHDEGQRPRWMIRLGLFLYDHLAKRKKLPGSKSLDLAQHRFGKPLKAAFEKGFQYSDCWVDDSRLVVLNALSAAEHGAHILTRTKCTGLKDTPEGWVVDFEAQGGKPAQAQAKIVVNAAGPWVRSVLNDSALVEPKTPNVKLVKGSHIIIDRAYEGEHAYILQQPDNRIVFAIPYEGRYTLIGTTEEDFEGDAYEARISEEEIAYLCAAYTRSFKTEITKDDVRWTYSGVRPLFDEGDESATAATRDYSFYECPNVQNPMLSIFGGKLTTHRVLAQEVTHYLMYTLDYVGNDWTSHQPLPGGDMPEADFDAFVEAQTFKYGWLEEALLYRYARSYGTYMDKILEGAKTMRSLGKHYGDGLYEAEVKYLISDEWARSAEDILWRRSKLGVHVDDKTIENLEKALPQLLKNLA